MRRIAVRRVLVPIALLIASILPLSLAAQAATHDIYDDSLHWDNWSWGTNVNTSSTSRVFDGSRSMAVTYEQGWAGLLLHTDGLSTGAYSNLEFALRPNGDDLPPIRARVYDSGGALKAVNIESYATSAGVAGMPCPSP